MRGLAKFIMEGKIPAELWVVFASLILAFNVQGYQFVFGAEFLKFLPVIMLINFVVLLLVGAPLAIGILRFNYARTLLFVLAAVLPLALVGKYQMLAFLAGIIVFAYALRVLKNMGYALVLTAVVLMPVLGNMQWMDLEQKENIYKSVISLKPQAINKKQELLGENSKLNTTGLETVVTKEAVAVYSVAIDTIVSTTIVFINIGLVLLARYLQSLLYYPGGFRREFLDLKINFWLAIATIIAIVLVSLFYLKALAYVSMLLVPFFFVGWSVMVYLSDKWQWNKHIFITLVIILVLLQSLAFAAILIVLGLIDSLIDVRKIVA